MQEDINQSNYQSDESRPPELKPEAERTSTQEESPHFDMGRADLISSLIICALGLYILGTGIHISFSENNGADVWYYSPGLFPAFIGAVLVVLSIILFVSKYKKGARIGPISLGSIKSAILQSRVQKLFVSIGLLAAYVFLAIGRIPFVVATFLYLAVTMTVFRKDNFAIWKIIVISAVATGMIYLLFGVIAAVPLP